MVQTLKKKKKDPLGFIHLKKIHNRIFHMLVMAFHLCWADLGIWPSATTGGTCCLLLNPHQTNTPISKVDQEHERRDQTSTAQLLNQKIKHCPSDHQGQPSPPAPPRILTPLLLPHCPHPQLISHWLRSWGTKNPNPNQWRGSLYPPDLQADSGTFTQEGTHQPGGWSFLQPGGWSFLPSSVLLLPLELLGGFDTFDWLDTFWSNFPFTRNGFTAGFGHCYIPIHHRSPTHHPAITDWSTSNKKSQSNLQSTASTLSENKGFELCHCILWEEGGF